MPERIQLRRTKGWRMPANTVKVDRATRWGNPFTVKACIEAGYANLEVAAAVYVVAAHRAWMKGERYWTHGAVLPPVPDLAPLRGKNLACWCPPGAPCHADVLLELANPPVTASPREAVRAACAVPTDPAQAAFSQGGA